MIVATPAEPAVIEDLPDNYHVGRRCQETQQYVEVVGKIDRLPDIQSDRPGRPT